MSIEGLDKIKQVEQNSKVEIGGLDMCRPVENNYDENAEEENNDYSGFEPRKISFGYEDEPAASGITGLDMCKPVVSDIDADNPADFSEDVLYYDELSESEVNITGLENIKHVSEPNLPKISSFAVKLIELQIAVDRHCIAGFDVVQHDAFLEFANGELRVGKI